MVVINFWLISFCLFPGAQYVKCRAQRCTEGNRQYLFPGHVDTNSLVVQDEYVFTQVCIVTDYFPRLNEASRRHLFMQRLLSMWSFDFLFFFFVVVCFYFALMCTQFILFHQNPCNSFLQHTCSPLARCVFWLCFVSFMSRHAQSLSFHTDILHAWKMCGKGTVNRQVGVLIILHSDFDSN